jgi:hypothetical protein
MLNYLGFSLLSLAQPNRPQNQLFQAQMHAYIGARLVLPQGGRTVAQDKMPARQP